MPIHIHAEPGSIAPLIVAVGDPGRAQLLSESLLNDAKVVNKNRGYLVYTGSYKDVDVTVATHGVGGPSALIVLEELAKLGARYVIRLGTTGALRRGMRIGDLVVAASAGCNYGGAGLGQYYPGICPPLAPDPLLTSILYEEASSRARTFIGPVFSSDAFYAEDKDFAARISSMGFIAVEMEVASLYALSWLRGFKAASLLMISNSLVEDLGYAGGDQLRDTVIKAGEAALESLTRISDIGSQPL
ncbi:MAG: purine-nucleoside phosphorylase [Desulfurococcales archaeon]|nr:purine-nucleoside phosphorylase [Desulfurococcales archaeon]MCE4605090.1 purine-nucleoside phosphorylase [Desulfurococcales archaeon]